MSRRRSKSTPVPRRVGPLAPKASASSAVIFATPFVRIIQIGFPVSRFSYSSTLDGKRLAKSRARSKNPIGGSSARPPMRKYEVIMRWPLTMSVFLYCFRERADILRLFEMVSGQRMITSYFRIGDLALEPPIGFFERVRCFANRFPSKVDEYENLVTGNPIWMMRTKGVAKITTEDALASGASGPTLRGSGVDFDLRRDMPYSSYEKFKFKVPISTHGDVFTRYMCRVQELRESIAMVQQALDGMPEGPIKADAPKVVLPDREKMKTQMEALIYHFKIITEGFAVPAGEVYQAVESPRGEMGYYVVSDGTAKPYRVHMRAACLANLQLLEKMCVGRLIADVVAAIGSIDIVLGEI